MNEEITNSETDRKFSSEKLLRKYYRVDPAESIRIFLAGYIPLALMHKKPFDLLFESSLFFGLMKPMLDHAMKTADKDESALMWIGSHGSITPTYHRGAPKKLSDGTTIDPGNKVGEINLIRNIPREASFLSFSRKLLCDLLRSLISIAEDPTAVDEKLADMVAFKGVSHLASLKLVKSLGFDVFEARLSDRALGALYGIYANRQASGFSRWKNFRKKWDSTQEVYISLETIRNNKEQYQELLSRISRDS